MCSSDLQLEVLRQAGFANDDAALSEAEEKLAITLQREEARERERERK